MVVAVVVVVDEDCDGSEVILVDEQKNL